MSTTPATTQKEEKAQLIKLVKTYVEAKNAGRLRDDIPDEALEQFESLLVEIGGDLGIADDVRGQIKATGREIAAEKRRLKRYRDERFAKEDVAKEDPTDAIGASGRQDPEFSEAARAEVDRLTRRRQSKKFVNRHSDGPLSLAAVTVVSQDAEKLADDVRRGRYDADDVRALIGEADEMRALTPSGAADALREDFDALMDSEVNISDDEAAPDTTTVNNQPPANLLDVAYYKAFARRVAEGDVTPQEVVDTVDAMVAHEEAVKASISEYTIKEIKSNFGGRSSRGKKADVVKAAYIGLLQDLLPTRGLSYSPFSETIAEAAQSAAREIDEQQIQDYAEDVAERRRERKEQLEQMREAVQDPQTLDDYRTFVEVRGKDALTDRQQITFDALRFEERLQKERSRVKKRAATGVDDVEFSIVEAYHEKRDIPLWVVQLSERVDRSKFSSLKRAAKSLGGWYSSYSRGQAKPGFQFEDEESAEAFVSAQTGEEVDDAVFEWRRKQIHNAEKIREVAERTYAKANERLEQDRKTNTRRRTRIARGIEAEERERLQLADTMMNVADALKEGDIKFLGGLRYRTEFKLLERQLSLAHWDYARQKSEEVGIGGPAAHEIVEQEPISELPPAKLLSYVEYPGITLDRHTVQKLVDQAEGVKGAKAIAKFWKRRLSGQKMDMEFGERATGYAKKKYLELYERTKDKAGLSSNFELRGLEKYRRMKRMDINTLSELRAALHEYMEYRGEHREADKLEEAIRDLKNGGKIEGFFPTPAGVISDMLAEAEIEPGMDVLEPSAGKGDIADAIRSEHPDANLTVIEQIHSLAKILEMKGYENLIWGDFLEHEETYDRILMNPPFERKQDIDHVQHAYSLLKPGGRVVSVMGEGAFFRSAKKDKRFRSWLAEHGESWSLPDGTFEGGDYSTSVATRLVVLNKPVEEPNANAPDEPGSTNNDEPLSLPVLRWAQGAGATHIAERKPEEATVVRPTEDGHDVATVRWSAETGQITSFAESAGQNRWREYNAAYHGDVSSLPRIDYPEEGTQGDKQAATRMLSAGPEIPFVEDWDDKGTDLPYHYATTSRPPGAMTMPVRSRVLWSDRRSGVVGTSTPLTLQQAQSVEVVPANPDAAAIIALDVFTPPTLGEPIVWRLKSTKDLFAIAKEPLGLGYTLWQSNEGEDPFAIVENTGLRDAFAELNTLVYGKPLSYMGSMGVRIFKERMDWDAAEEPDEPVQESKKSDPRVSDAPTADEVSPKWEVVDPYWVPRKDYKGPDGKLYQLGDTPWHVGVAEAENERGTHILAETEARTNKAVKAFLAEHDDVRATGTLVRQDGRTERVDQARIADVDHRYFFKLDRTEAEGGSHRVKLKPNGSITLQAVSNWFNEPGTESETVLYEYDDGSRVELPLDGFEGVEAYRAEHADDISSFFADDEAKSDSRSKSQSITQSESSQDDKDFVSRWLGQRPDSVPKVADMNEGQRDGLDTYLYASLYRPVGGWIELPVDWDIKWSSRRRSVVGTDKPLALDVLKSYELVPVNDASVANLVRRVFGMPEASQPLVWRFQRGKDAVAIARYSDRFAVWNLPEDESATRRLFKKFGPAVSYLYEITDRPLQEMVGVYGNELFKERAVSDEPEGMNTADLGAEIVAYKEQRLGQDVRIRDLQNVEGDLWVVLMEHEDESTLVPGTFETGLYHEDGSFSKSQVGNEKRMTEAYQRLIQEYAPESEDDEPEGMNTADLVAAVRRDGAETTFDRVKDATGTRLTDPTDIADVRDAWVDFVESENDTERFESVDAAWKAFAATSLPDVLAALEPDEEPPEPASGDATDEEPKGTPSSSIQVRDIPLDEIHTDEERFQPRGDAFSEETARKVAESYDPALMDPIDLWRDPEDGKLYVLGGHSRLAGFRRAGRDTIPATIKDFDERAAIRYALLDNDKGTSLTNSERAAVLRGMRASGEFDSIKEQREFAKEMYDRNARVVFDLSWLDPKGKALSVLRQFEGQNTADAKEAETMAQWVGKQMYRHRDDFERRHENEMFDFLKDNYRTKGRKITSAAQFQKFIDDAKARAGFMGSFDPSDMLNLNNIRPKTQQESRIDQQLQEKREAVRDAEKALSEKRRDLIERDASDEDMERILKDFELHLRRTQEEYIKAKKEADTARKHVQQTQTSMFARENPMLPGGYVLIGVCTALQTTRTTLHPRGRWWWMFTTEAMDSLLLLPYGRVHAEDNEDVSGSLEQAFKTWHSYDPRNLELALYPTQGEEIYAGEAVKILYTSDKVMQPGDAQGKVHHYYHDFVDEHSVRMIDDGETATVLIGMKRDEADQILSEKTVEIDERGILN
ncbi:gp43 [Salisaeta icosahedral phage 1]|uniref:DNA methyltransferase n=1 Tax=Salisaeta icosahedral phage 1 TaxID=1183239 RepID=UPI00025EA938|nr:DNA methyltransferase [Salisaeta icosahedral phage 1]AFJ21498.1 gp43 [Salisaeta icosahedral phage 1]